MDTTKVLRSRNTRLVTECLHNARIYRVRCDIANRRTMQNLSDSVEKALNDGLRDIIISFTADSYLFSEIIPHLIRLNDMVQQRGGTFRILESDAELRAILGRIGITKIVNVVETLPRLPHGTHLDT